MPGFDPHAPKQTISLQINADLVRLAREQGEDLSSRVERLLARDAETSEGAGTLESRMQAAAAATQAFIDKHGSFSDEHADW